MLQMIWLEMRAASTGYDVLQACATVTGFGWRWGGVHRQRSFSLGPIRDHQCLFCDPAVDLNRGGGEHGAVAARSSGGGWWSHDREGEGEDRRGGIAGGGRACRGGWGGAGTELPRGVEADARCDGLRATPAITPRDGNGSSSDRVECLGTKNQNPNLKPETDSNTDSGENSCPKPNPRITETRLDTRNPLRMATYEEQSRLL
jgi:hypothetical protein